MRAAFFFVMCFPILLLSSCEFHQLTNEKKQVTKEKKMETEFDNFKAEQNLLENIQPIEAEENTFQNITGWFHETAVLYIKNLEDRSEVICHDLQSGKDELFFQTKHPIIQTVPNDRRTIFLIHSSPETNQAILTFVNTEGEELFHWEINAFELQYTWNPYNEKELMVTAFAEDWSYKTYLLDLKEKKVVDSPYQIPFFQWTDEDRITYVKWNNDEPELSAPLYEANLMKHHEKKIADHVIGNGNFSSIVMYLQENQQEKGFGQYVFINSSSKKVLSTFRVPLASDYSQWIFPYYDFNAQNQQFYTFVPVAKSQDGSFELQRFNLITKKKETIFKNVTNDPILISPSGHYALYGPRLEKIMDLSKEKIQEIVK